MILRVCALALLLLAPLHGPGSGPLPVQSLKDDDFAEFEDDDSEFDFEVADDEDEEDEDYGVDEDRGAGQFSDDLDDEEDGDFDNVDGNLEDDESFEAELDEEEFEKKVVPDSGKVDIKLSESAVKIGPIWKTYVLEMVVVAGMAVYLINYFIGRTKNSNMAYSWFDSHTELLRSNFSVVGDSGEGEEPTQDDLIRVSDDTFTLWCTGRQNCSGMLVHMQFCRRHDLLSVAYQLVQKKRDMISLILQLSDDEEVDKMDSFVLAIGTKKTLQRMQKEYEDLKNLTTTIRPLSKAESLFYISEIPEATQSFLSERNTTFLAKHADCIESIHITDQYTGFVQDTDDAEAIIVRKPEKRIIINFYATLYKKEGPFLKFALQVLDQIKNIRLSRESKEKALQHRSAVSAKLDKLQHNQRQEAAQQRREEKVRARKEKTMLLSESDPEKARKLEEKENRRARKKMQPKVKNMKVHAA